MDKSLWAPKFSKGHREECLHDNDFRERKLREEVVASEECHLVRPPAVKALTHQRRAPWPPSALLSGPFQTQLVLRTEELKDAIYLGQSPQVIRGLCRGCPHRTHHNYLAISTCSCNLRLS